MGSVSFVSLSGFFIYWFGVGGAVVVGLSNLFPFYIYTIYISIILYIYIYIYILCFIYLYLFLLGFVTLLISNLFFLFFPRGVRFKKSITFEFWLIYGFQCCRELQEFGRYLQYAEKLAWFILYMIGHVKECF